jgi:hypothetical protein
MKYLLGLAGILAAAASGGAVAQVLVPAQQPQTIIVQQPGTVVGSPPPVVVGPSAVPADAVVVSRVYVPQGVINTTAVQPAPFAPAPAGTVLETTADRRLVKTVDGYDVVYDVNGQPLSSHALFTDGLESGKYSRREAESIWPLEVGKSETFNVDGSGGVRAIHTRVLRTEVVNVPAGSFYTYVVERRDRSLSDNSENVSTYWYAPSIGSVVKFEERLGRPGRPRPAYELTTVRLPYAIPGAVVVQATRRPDTLENQAQFCHERGTTLRLADGRVLMLDCPAYVQAERLSYENWLLVR